MLAKKRITFEFNIYNILNQRFVLYKSRLSSVNKHLIYKG